QLLYLGEWIGSRSSAVLTRFPNHTIVPPPDPSPRGGGGQGGGGAGRRAMQLIAPDIFSEVGQLSAGACVLGFTIGFLIWLTGWWQHRFWVVASLTAIAGI